MSGGFLMLKINDYLPAKYNKNQAKLPGDGGANSSAKQQIINNTAPTPPKSPVPPVDNFKSTNQQPITEFKKKKRFPTVASLAIIGLFVVATAVGFYLMQSNQDTRQQAYVPGKLCDNEFEVSDGNNCLINNSSSKTLQAWVWTCPDMTWAEAGAGCQENLEIVYVAPNSRVCLGSDYCGVRQIDGFDGGNLCFVSGYNDCTPTPPPTTITPTPTLAACSEACQVDGDCKDGLECVITDGTNGLCSIPEYSDACLLGQDYQSCCEAPEALMCRNIEILNELNQPLTTNDDDSFVPGETTIKFKCYASDAERVDHFEFAVIEPDGNISYLQENANTPSISNDYLINQDGNFAAECRLCETTDSCQSWTSSVLSDVNKAWYGPYEEPPFDSVEAPTDSSIEATSISSGPTRPPEP